MDDSRHILYSRSGKNTIAVILKGGREGGKGRGRGGEGSSRGGRKDEGEGVRERDEGREGER